jgi:hypothetical protein
MNSKQKKEKKERKKEKKAKKEAQLQATQPNPAIPTPMQM